MLVGLRELATLPRHLHFAVGGDLPATAGITVILFFFIR